MPDDQLQTLAWVMAWVMAICSSLMAGVYLAFSVVIMKSLATLQPSQGIEAMNAINRVILKSAFMPLFFGSSLIALVMILTGSWFIGEPGAGATISAGVVYFFGMFVSTAVGNVPLNNRLAKVSGENEVAVRVWNNYLKRWTRWNTSRTICSLTAMLICLDFLSR